MRDPTENEPSGLPTNGRGPGRWTWATDRGGELAVAALFWFGLHEFAHLRLTAVEWSAVLAAWFALWCAGTLGPWWVLGAVGVAGPGAALSVGNRYLSRPLSGGQEVYLVVGVTVVVALWRVWLAWRVRRGADPLAEPLRVLLVGVAPLVVLLPFFTDRLMGGTDARWYALMLHDFIEQLRGGVFPVFVGQGEFAWNGGVHPFRSAPVYLHVAGLWDFLTARTLNAPALQHLAVLTTGLVGALGFYAAAAALLPTRRWVAAGFAVLYALAPAWLAVLYWNEAYMTFMALAALPAVLYGNARTLLDEGERGYGWLAVGLALVWMCHPPMAVLSTLLTALMQGGSLLLGKSNGRRWLAAARGAALFAGLSAYYFVGMAELPRAPGTARPDALQVAGLILTLAALGNGLRGDRSRWWWLLAPVGAGLAGLGRGPWLPWLLVTSVIVGGLVLARRGRALAGGWVVVGLFVALLAGAGLTQAWVGPEHPARNLETLGIFKDNAAHQWAWFEAVPANLGSHAMYQPGAGLWLIGALLAVAFLRPGALAVKLFLVAASLPLLGLMRLPGASDFLVGFVPNMVAGVVNLPLPIRLMPILAAWLAMGGVVWWATRSEGAGTPWRWRVKTWCLVAAVGGAFLYATPFMRRGWAVTESRTRTENRFRPENAVLERFAYDLLQHPAYLTHGWIAPWLQARVLDHVEQVVIGPDETARRLEESGARRVRLTGKDYPTNPVWLTLSPTLKVESGERLLVRFEFDPKQDYAGWLIMSSELGYREYHLPDAGLPLAFGTGAPNSRVIALGNSGDRVESYRLTFMRERGNTLKGNDDPFGDIVVSRFDPERVAVRVDSLRPYKVTATVPAAGWIETSRVWLPGYTAKLDGKPVELKRSHRGLAMAAAGPGRHELELDYTGTGRLWFALWVSALMWVGWLAWTVRAQLNPRSGHGNGN